MFDCLQKKPSGLGISVALVRELNQEVCNLSCAVTDLDLDGYAAAGLPAQRCLDASRDFVALLERHRNGETLTRDERFGVIRGIRELRTQRGEPSLSSAKLLLAAVVRRASRTNNSCDIADAELRVSGPNLSEKLV